MSGTIYSFFRGFTKKQIDNFIQEVAGSGSATDADAIHDNVDGEIAAITEKTTPVDADLLLIEDSAASNAKKKAQADNLVVSISQAQDPQVLPRLYQIDNLANNAATSIDFGENVFAGIVAITQNNLSTPDAYGIIGFRAASSSAFVSDIVLGADCRTRTGVLTGTTGTSSKLTVSPHTDQKLYFENRLGGPRTFCVLVAGVSLSTPSIN